jgi:hypothetical protein
MSGSCAPTVGGGRVSPVRFMPEWRYRGNISVHPHRRATAHPTGREGGSVSAPGSALDGKHARQGSACRAYLSLVGSSSTREAAEVAQQHAAVGRVESDSRRMAISRKRWDPLASSGFGTAWIRYSVDSVQRGFGTAWMWLAAGSAPGGGGSNRVGANDVVERGVQRAVRQIAPSTIGGGPRRPCLGRHHLLRAEAVFGVRSTEPRHTPPIR